MRPLAGDSIIVAGRRRTITRVDGGRLFFAYLDADAWLSTADCRWSSHETAWRSDAPPSTQAPGQMSAFAELDA